jgi:hypothetical protein
VATGWGACKFSYLYNDDPNDRGIAGVDIFKFNSDGKIVEHWDVLQGYLIQPKLPIQTVCFDDIKPRQTPIRLLTFSKPEHECVISYCKI